MAICVEVTLEYLGITADAAWELLRASHPSLLSESKQIDLYGDMHLVSDMPEAIKRKGKPHFRAEFSEGELDYAPVENPRLNQLFIKGCITDVDDAWTWVRPIATCKQFRSARVFDQDYEFWQNAEDPIQYEGSGRSYAGLPMKSNGLPYPLEQRILDISKNPGRRVFRQGYVEAVGAVMWLGEQFWPLTGASRQEVLAADWLQCEQLPHGVLRVQAANAPFTTAEGASGVLQDRLRALLFPQSSCTQIGATWPRNSPQ
jgi:hypothetical protein